MRNSGLLVGLAMVAAAGCTPAEVVTAMNDLAHDEDLRRPEGICEKDDDCAGLPETPRCDPQTSLCVACLPAPMDNCAMGQICQKTNGVWGCGTVCTGNADCAKLGGGSLC